MTLRRCLPTLIFAAFAAGAIACASEELNPQPLPPVTEPDGPKGGSSGTTSGSEYVPGTSTSGSASGGGSSSSSSGFSDAGDAGDAADAAEH